MDIGNGVTVDSVARAARKAARRHRHLLNKDRRRVSEPIDIPTETTSPMHTVRLTILPGPERGQAAEATAMHVEQHQERDQEIPTGLRVCNWIANGDTSRAWHEPCADDNPDEEQTHLGTALIGAWLMTDQARSDIQTAVTTSNWGNTTALDLDTTEANLDGSEITPEILMRFSSLLTGDIVLSPVDWCDKLLKSKYVKEKIGKSNLTVASSMRRMIGSAKGYDLTRTHLILCKPATGPWLLAIVDTKHGIVDV